RRASLWAVAVMAFGAPRRVLRRRKKAPSADLLWCRERAARRSAAAARLAEGLVRPLSVLPPETFVPGARVSQEAQCLSLGQRLMSRRVSATTLRAVGASMPSMRVRSTPVRRERWVRTSKVGAVRFGLVVRGLAGSVWPAVWSAKAAEAP